MDSSVLSSIGVSVTDPPSFFEGEKVIAFHQSKYYEAKILKVEMRNKQNAVRLGEQEPVYLIHYQGWKNKWDEWVNESRMLKHNEENKVKLLNLVQPAEKPATTTKKRPSRKVVREPSPVARPKKKQKIETPVVPPANPAEKPLVSLENLELPSILQKLLAEDYDQIVNHKNLINLSLTPTVSHILATFADAKYNENENAELNTSVLSGLQNFFDEALGSLLLYKFERIQYQQILGNLTAENPRQLSEFYGSYHLLRLFYILPRLLSEADFSDTSRNAILISASDVLEFLEKNALEYFNPKAYYRPSELYFAAFEKS